MARRRFFVPAIRRGAAELVGTDAEHLVRVLRVEAGERYEISDNESVFLAEVQTARKSLVVFQTIELIPRQPAAVEITLLAALFKFDHLEWLIEKATELGVTTIRPFEATRSERGLAQASAKRLARWERIVLEASQQSRRDHLPRVEPTARFRSALDLAADVRLLLDEDRAAPPLLGSLPARRTVSQHVALLLGPEGGWTEEERSAAQTAGWQSCSLAPGVLRAETAGIAALSIVTAAWAHTASNLAGHDDGMHGTLPDGQYGEERSA